MNTARTLELAPPDLPDEVVAEAVVRLLLDELEAGRDVDAARGDEHVVGPQHHALIAGGAGEVDAGGHELGAEAEPAGPRADEQQPQLGGVGVALLAEHAAGTAAVDIGDPRLLAAGD